MLQNHVEPSFEPLVRLEHVSKRFGQTVAVDDLSFEVGRNEFFALLGPSGCGKTSLLRLLAGFEQPDRGRICIDGEDMCRVPAHRRPVNIMFQSYALFPHMNVAANIAFGLVQEGIAKAEIEARVGEMLKLVQLEGLERRRAHQLSGGQKQRVALARALIKRPKLLLLDEPLAAVDQRLREETQYELINLQARLGTTFIIVTHDQREAMAMAQRIAVMRAGKIEQIGTPAEIYGRPCSLYIAEFIGNINMLCGFMKKSVEGLRIISTKYGTFEIAAGIPLAEGQRVNFAVRPERLLMTAEKPSHTTNILSGEITERVYLGETTSYRISLSSGEVLRLTRQNDGVDQSLFQLGQKVHVTFARDAAIIFEK